MGFNLGFKGLINHTVTCSNR